MSTISQLFTELPSGFENLTAPTGTVSSAFSLPSSTISVNSSGGFASSGSIYLPAGPYTFLSGFSAISNLNTATTITATFARTGSPIFPSSGTLNVISNLGIQSVSYTGVNTASTTIAAGSNGFSLPQSKIYVASASTFGTYGGSVNVVTSAGTQLVYYTGLDFINNALTGCTGGTGSMTTGGSVSAGVSFTGVSTSTGAGYVSQANLISPSIQLVNYSSTTTFSTSIASGSNTNNLPQATIYVNSTSGLSSSGNVAITSSAGTQFVSYTGTTGGATPTLTGCTGGTGEILTGNAVSAVNAFTQCINGSGSVLANAPVYGGPYVGQIGNMGLTNGQYISVLNSESTSVNGIWPVTVNATQLNSQYITLNGSIAYGIWQMGTGGSVYPVWQTPTGVNAITLYGVGGGGGGGGGGSGVGGTSSNSQSAQGGGGGGGAQSSEVKLSVTPNTFYTITVGAGGSAGSRGPGTTGQPGISGTAGGSGAATSFAFVTNQVQIASVSNTTPIEVTTVGPHGFASNYVVTVSSNNTIGGTYVITVIDSTHFTLTNTTAPGSTSTGGFVYGADFLAVFVGASGGASGLGAGVSGNTASSLTFASTGGSPAWTPSQFMPGVIYNAPTSLGSGGYGTNNYGAFGTAGLGSTSGSIQFLNGGGAAGAAGANSTSTNLRGGGGGGSGGGSNWNINSATQQGGNGGSGSAGADSSQNGGSASDASSAGNPIGYGCGGGGGGGSGSGATNSGNGGNGSGGNTGALLITYTV